MCEKCPHSDFYLVCIQTGYGDLPGELQYLAATRKIRTTKNSGNKLLSRSVNIASSASVKHKQHLLVQSQKWK